MVSTGLVIACVSLWLSAPAGGSVAARSLEPPARIEMTAVMATKEGKTAADYGPGLEGVKSLLADMEADYDTFRKAAGQALSIPFETETELPVDEKYSVFVKPLTREKTGGIRAQVRVTMRRKPGDTPVNAVVTTLQFAPGKPMKLRGLKRASGELALVLRFVK